MIQKYDREKIYCPMLGHQLNFFYCRLHKEDLPCFKILDCWFERVPIKEYINKNYSRREIEKILWQPLPKITSLVEMIKKAKKRR